MKLKPAIALSLGLSCTLLYVVLESSSDTSKSDASQLLAARQPASHVPSSPPHFREPVPTSTKALSQTDVQGYLKDSWDSEVLSSADYAFALLPKNVIMEPFLAPSRDYFIQLLKSRFDGAASLDIDTLLLNLPVGHPFWTKHAQALDVLLQSAGKEQQVGDVFVSPTEEDLAAQWESARNAFASALQWHALRRHVSNFAKCAQPTSLNAYFVGDLVGAIPRLLPGPVGAELSTAMYELEAAHSSAQQGGSRTELNNAERKVLGLLTAEYNARDTAMCEALGLRISFLSTVGIIAGSIELKEFHADDMRWSGN